MKKNSAIYAAALLAALAVVACKNNPSAPAEMPGANMAYPFEKPDSMFGYEGCLMTGFRAYSPTEREFVYQDYTMRVKDKADGVGQDVELMRDSTRIFSLPVSNEAGFFQGMARNHLFFDVGTGPGIRQLLLYSVKENDILQVYRTDYLPDVPPFVSSNGGLWFYTPIEESEMVKMPDCPDKEKWLKEGQRVGYGQRCVYNLVDRMLVKKSEYICVPLQ